MSEWWIDHTPPRGDREHPPPFSLSWNDPESEPLRDLFAAMGRVGAGIISAYKPMFTAVAGAMSRASAGTHDAAGVVDLSTLAWEPPKHECHPKPTNLVYPTSHRPVYRHPVMRDFNIPHQPKLRRRR
jgi:hypothetical protein